MAHHAHAHAHAHGGVARGLPFHPPNTVTAVHVGAVVHARRMARAAPWHSLFTFVADDDVTATARAGAAAREGVDSWRRRGLVPADRHGRECHVVRVPGGLAAAEGTLVERMVPYIWTADGYGDEGAGLLLITDAEWTGQVGSQVIIAW